MKASTLTPFASIATRPSRVASKRIEVGPNRLHDDYLMKPFDLRQLLEKIHTLLDIEWTYDSESGPPRPRIPPVLPLTPALAIPDIDDLMYFSQIGYVRGIQEKLAEIERNSPLHHALVMQMRAVADSFDLKRLTTMLEALRSTHV